MSQNQDQRSTTPTGSPPPPDQQQQADGAPTLPASAPTEAEAGPSRRGPISISYTVPLGPPDGTGGEPGNTITWTFEVFPTGSPPSQPGERLPPGEGADASAAHAEGPQPQPQPQPESDPERPSLPAPPRIGPFGLADARPPNPAADGPGRPPRRTPVPLLPMPHIIFAGGGPGPPGAPGAGGEGTGPGQHGFDWHHILQHLMPMLASGVPDRRPDPAKAAELLRALPTVDKAMMDRVDRLISADKEEDEDGWRCSICFEGADAVPDSDPAASGAEGGSGDGGDVQMGESAATAAAGAGAIKATPCHHLFHAGCLEPWFATRTSCPMCRESLDALGTQNDNETRSARRPRPARTQTPSTHPYARPAPNRTSSQSAQSAQPATASDQAGPSTATPAPVPAQANEAATGRGATPPTPFPPMPMPMLPFLPPPPPGQTGRMPFMAIINIGPNGPEPPRPLGMPPTTGTDNNNNNGNAAAAPSGGLGLGGPNVTDTPLHTSPMPMDRLSSPVPGPTPGLSVAPNAQTAVDAHIDPPRPALSPPQRRAHVDVDESMPVPVEAGSSTDAERGPHPHHHHHHHHHLHGRPSTTAPAPAPARPPPPRQSLSAWILSKERDIGLTCASTTCQWLTTPRPSSKGLPLKDAELLSIRSPLATPRGSPAPTAADGSQGRDAQKNACAHKWHRDCLEQSTIDAEQPDAEGRSWVTCGACQSRGWITPRDDAARSEGEVEKMVHWQSA